MRRWIAVVILCFAACEVADSALSLLGQPCTLDSDCDGELVCVYQRCHQACRDSADCPLGERCIRGGSQGAVCQLEDESRCALHSQCPEPLLCGPDGRCRDQCRADDDCVSGQLCVTGVCADPEELQNGQLPSQENEQGEGKPCIVHSDCPDELLCIEGKCLYECQTHYDCPSGECKEHHCVPLAPPTAPCAPGQQVSCRCMPGVPGVHVCNEDGLGYSDCMCPQGSTGTMGGGGTLATGGSTGMGGMSMGGSMMSVGGGPTGTGGMSGVGGATSSNSSSSSTSSVGGGPTSSSSSISSSSVGGGPASSSSSSGSSSTGIGGGGSGSSSSGSSSSGPGAGGFGPGGMGTGLIATAGAASTDQ